MANHRVQLRIGSGHIVGFIEQDWLWLPETIKLDGQVYLRDGPSGAQFYRRLDEPMVITESNTTKVVCYD